MTQRSRASRSRLRFLNITPRELARRTSRSRRVERLETRALLAASAIMDQFLVDETSSLEESPSAVAVIESSGNFVAAWTSFEQPGGDESGLGVYAQRFNADGTSIGAPVLVNAEQTAGDQFAPQVAVDGQGNFMVVWQGPDADGSGVYGQRYTFEGALDGVSFQVNNEATGDQQAPSVAMDNLGNAIVTWQSNGEDGEIERVYAKRYDADGNSGSEFPINSVMVGNQTSPTADVSRGNGNFVIAWEGEVIGSETSVEIFAQLYDSNAAPIGSEIQVNTTTLRDQVSPDIAMDAAGNFVATWTSEGIPGSGSDVFAQRFDASGAASGSEFRVNETVLQGQLNSVVAVDGDGDFFVIWQSSHQDAFSWGIFGRAYDAAGTPLSTEFQVNTYAEQPQTSPAVGSNTEGQAVALWLGLDEDHASAVHAQRYQLPKTGVEFSAVGEELVLANYLGLEDASAAVAVDANRNFFVVWQSYGEDGSGLGILGRRLDRLGNPLGDAFVINTTTDGNQTNPAVAMDSAGNSVVVWEAADQDADGHGIFAQRFDSEGNPVGSEFLVNSEQLGDQSQPSIAMNPESGDFVIVWQGPDESGKGIFGQRFDANGNTVGDWFPVNQETYLDQVSPTVSMNSSGEFAVAWVSDHRVLIDPENDSEKSIFVQWYDATGTADGDEQLVHSIVKEYQAQEYPDVALDASGNMIVVWQSITQDGSAWGVFGRQLTAAKELIGDAEFQINQTTAENQRRATVVADPAGNFTVSWQSDLQDQSATAIVSRQYNSDASAETDEMVVNTWEIGPQILPVMAMTPGGDYGIFWSGQGLSRSDGVHGRIYEEGYIPPAPHLSVVPKGDQFLVSEAAGLEQSFPAVAVVEQTGNYVAAWTSFEQPEYDESGLGIYAQQFEPDGTPIGAAFLVNVSYTTDDQSNPGVAVDGDGNFVVVWQSLGQDGDGLGIFAQRYRLSTEGAGVVEAVGDVIAVNLLTTGDQSHPAVAMDNEGNFVVTWQSDTEDGNGLDIHARRYDAAGNPLESQEFRVNSIAEGNQSAPTVSRSRLGSQFVIGWQSEILGGEGEIDVEVLGKLYAADSNVLLDDFIVNTTAEHDQVGPHVAMAADGGFVFAWTAEGQIGSGADVYARRFDSAGAGLEDNFLVNETTGQGQQYPAVGIDADGNFLITWQSSHQDGFSWGIFAKAYDVDRNVLAEEFQVNVNVQGPQTNPALNANSQGDAIVTWLGLDAQHHPAVHAQRYLLPTTEGSEFTVGPEGEIVLSNYVALEDAPAAAAVDANGNYVVTWQSYGEDGSGLGVFARQFNAAGDPLGEAFLVNNTTDGNQSHPDVAVDASGRFMIVWQSDSLDGSGYDIFARRFDENGTAEDAEFRVNTTIAEDQGKPAVALNPDDGGAVIVWQSPEPDDGLGIFGQRYNPDGSPLGDEFHVNTFTALDQVSPTIAMNAAGEFVVAWVSDHRAEFDPTDTEKSIFFQWFDTNGDTDGEEVLAHSIQAEFEAQEHPDVAINPDGSFVLAWQSINQDGNTWGVFARQFLADKTPIQPIEFQVNQTVLAPQRHASVATDSDGNFVVAWQGHAQDASGPGVFARAYDSAAVAQTDEFLVPTWDQGPQTYPVLAMTDSGEFGVYWTGHGIDRAEGVHGRLYAIYDEVTVSSIGLYQPDLSFFHLRETLTDGEPDLSFAFGPGGSAGWAPITGDWNADGIDTIGLYQPDLSLFHLKDSFTGGDADYFFAFGPTGDLGWIPLAGDWNGDGVDTIGLYQPDLSLFHLKDSFSGGDADHFFAFGPSGNVGWVPLVGDWNNDGVDTIGLYQPDLSLFHLKDSFTGGDADHFFAFGPTGDVGWTPLAGDWNGDGVDTIGLHQPDLSLFHLKDSFSGGNADHYITFGPTGYAGWIPLAGDWNGPESSAPATDTAFATFGALETGLIPESEELDLIAENLPLATLDDPESDPDGLGDAESISTSPDESPLQLLDEAFAIWN